MNSEVRIITNTLLSYVARVVRAGIAFLLIPYLLHALGEGAYGVIGIISSILGFVLLIELGIRPAATREFTRFVYSGEVRRSNELASTAMVAYVAAGAVMVVCVALAGPFALRLLRVPEELVPDGQWALLLAACALAVSLSTTPYTAALASRLRHDVQHYSDIAETILRGGLIVFTFSLWQPSLKFWALATVIPSLIVLVVLRRQAHRNWPSLALGGRYVSRRGLRDLSGSGAYTSLAQIAEWLNRQSGPLIISYCLGAELVAHYTPGMVLATAVQMLSSGFLLQLQPFLTKAAVEQDFALIGRVLTRSTRYSLLSTGAAAAWLAAVSPVFVSCWLGPDFRDTARVLVLWSGTIFLHACVGAAFSVFLGTGRFAFVAFVNTVLGVASVGGTVGLVNTGYGVEGAAVAVFGAQAIRTAVWIRGSTRIANLRAGDYLRDSYIGPLTCIALLVATSIGVQTIPNVGEWARLLLAGGLSLAVFGGAAWWIGLTEADRTKALDYTRRGWRRTVRLLSSWSRG